MLLLLPLQLLNLLRLLLVLLLLLVQILLLFLLLHLHLNEPIFSQNDRLRIQYTIIRTLWNLNRNHTQQILSPVMRRLLQPVTRGTLMPIQQVAQYIRPLEPGCVLNSVHHINHEDLCSLELRVCFTLDVCGSRVISVPTLVASLVPLYWSSRHKQTSLHTVPIDSSQVAQNYKKLAQAWESP